MAGAKMGWKNKGLWVLTIVVSLAFMMFGGMKLTSPAEMVANFTRWGYPSWFIYFIGVVELSAAIVLLVPRLASYAAAVLGGVMVGGAITHLVFDPPSQASAAVVLLALLFVVGWARRPAFLRKRESLRTSKQSV